jgi:hypothetical protein
VQENGQNKQRQHGLQIAKQESNRQFANLSKQADQQYCASQRQGRTATEQRSHQEHSANNFCAGIKNVDEGRALHITPQRNIGQ